MTIAKLVALLVDGGKKSTYILQFAAPDDDNKALVAPAKLVLGDSKVVDLGVIAAPTQATWRTMRSLTLVENVTAAKDGQEATLLWGTQTLVATVVDGGAVVVPPGPTTALLRVSPVANSPLERTVEVQIDKIGAGERVRIDAGGSNQRQWTPTSADKTGEVGYKMVWDFTYAKTGHYLIVVDHLDGDGYWVDQLAEQELNVSLPDVITTPDGKPLTDNSSSYASPPEVTDAAATLPAWEPFRYARPAWSGVRMYTQPGGTRVTRGLYLGMYIAIKAETIVSGAAWYQSVALDWIPASSVIVVTPSALRGVELAGTGPGPGPDPDPDPDPDPNPDPDPDPGNLPKGVVTANVLNVRSGAGTNFPVVDQLRFNAQVSIYEQKAVSGATWYRIGTGRWVHSGWVRLLSSPPPGPQPARKGVVTADVLNVRANPGVATDNPPIDRLLKGAQVDIFEDKVVAGATWYRIGTGRWVHGGWIRLITSTSAVEPADEGGPSLEAQAVGATALPLGWVVTGPLNVRAEPNTTSNIVGQVNKYDRLSILETKVVLSQRWYRIGDNRWVIGTNVDVARIKARPAAFRADEKWVAVNLREQTIVAYEGDKAVYTALAATGLAGFATVQGMFRTWLRLVWGKMAGGSGAFFYDLEAVPWTMYFYSGYALHGAYWHDAFGRQRSHGCVNLTLYDSWWLFKWSEPSGKNSPAVYVYWE